MKLCDFAHACLFDNHDRKYTGIIGSLNYLAPEMVRRESYGCKVDVWGAMVVIFSLVTGNLPFYSEVKRDLIDQILNKDLDLVLSAYDLSEEARAFLTAGLERDPSKRPTCRQMLAHEWLNQEGKAVSDTSSSNGLNSSTSTISTRYSDSDSSLSQEDTELPFIDVNQVLKKAVCQLLAGQAIARQKILIILRGLIEFIRTRSTERSTAKSEVLCLQSLHR